VDRCGAGRSGVVHNARCRPAPTTGLSYSPRQDRSPRPRAREATVPAAAPVMRLRSPRWKDPRQTVSIALVLARVLMGAPLVSGLSETTPVLVTRSPLAPGDPIRPESLSAVEIRLGEQVGAYVGSIDAIPDGAVATRAVDAGELLPISALGQSA